MVTLLLDSTRLEVALSTSERLLAFRKQNVFVERSTIVKVQLIEDAWTWLRGVASPGTHVPGVMAMGTWKSTGGDDFVVIRRRRPAVVIDLEGHDEFQRLVLTTSHGVALAKALHLDGEGESDVARVVGSEAKPAAPKKPAAAKKPRTAPKPATA